MHRFLAALQRFFVGFGRGAVAAGRRMWDTGGTNLAATLAFYAMLSIFPLMILVIALISWIAVTPDSVNRFLNTLSEFAPAYVIDTIRGPLERLVGNGTGAGTVFGIGIILVIWSASGYVGAFGWSANQVGGVQEKRPYLRRLALRMGVALLVAIVLLLAVTAIGLTKNAAAWVGKWIADLGGTIDVWSTVRWPLFFLAAFVLALILFGTGPYQRRLSFRETAPGALVGVLLWGLSSWGFGIYLKYVSQYSMIYGSMAAIVVFMMWLWLFNLALLYGVSVNAEIRDWRVRRREDRRAAELMHRDWTGLPTPPRLDEGGGTGGRALGVDGTAAAPVGEGGGVRADAGEGEPGPPDGHDGDDASGNDDGEDVGTSHA